MSVRLSVYRISVHFYALFRLLCSFIFISCIPSLSNFSLFMDNLFSLSKNSDSDSVIFGIGPESSFFSRVGIRFNYNRIHNPGCNVTSLFYINKKNKELPQLLYFRPFLQIFHLNEESNNISKQRQSVQWSKVIDKQGKRQTDNLALFSRV